MAKKVDLKSFRTSEKTPEKHHPTKKSSPGFLPFEWRDLTPAPIIGVDEVGRGCLAGSVYAGACLLNPTFSLEGVTDSKLISENRREILAPIIQSHHQVSIAFATVEEIDELNILWAAMLAMRRAVEDLTKRLGISEATILVDGSTRIPDLAPGFRQITVVKGDLRAEPISAASIVAKVARDHEMRRLGRDFPGYGFEKHKGYGSAAHRQAISKLGPCIWHRRSFSGVKEHISSVSKRSPA